MDATKSIIHAGIAVALALLLTAPVAAQEETPPDEGARVNSLGVQSGQLPAPLPEMPAGISLPDLSLPIPRSEEWPSTDTAGDMVREDVEGVVGDVSDVLTSNYDFVLERIYDARRVTNQLNQVVGSQSALEIDEYGIMTAESETAVSATSLATDLAGSIRYAMAYLRSISSLGPLGLDLVFVLVGLGWIVLVNMSDLAIRLVAWLLGVIGKVLGFGWRVIEGLLRIVDVVLKVVDIIWPF